MSEGKGKRIAFHVLAALVGLAFVGSAVAKLTGTPEMVENFARWGYPDWFIYFTGALEGVAALLVVIPKTRIYGAALLVATMVGAFLTHAMAGEFAQTVPALVLGALNGLLFWSSGGLKGLLPGRVAEAG